MISSGKNCSRREDERVLYHVVLTTARGFFLILVPRVRQLICRDLCDDLFG